jgi:GNAT superfamily N-acetyltransferase
MRQGEERDACRIVRESFSSFVAPDYSAEGVREFLKYADPVAMRRRFREGHVVLLAVAGERILGVMEIREFRHISLLFVDRADHRQGVARDLLNKALEICTEERPSLAEITVFSSPYAVEIYEHLGFRRTGPERTCTGIRFIPMSLTLEDNTRSPGCQEPTLPPTNESTPTSHFD